MEQYATTAESTRWLKSQLRKWYPDTKFSIRGSRGTGYGWVNIHWTDGPTESEVSDRCDQFTNATFDGMIDAYHYHPATLPDGRRSGIKSILYNREDSSWNNT